MKIENKHLAIVLGGLTLVLFSTKPYILDLIEPAKSIGEVIGENAKDLLKSLNGEENIKTSNTKREVLSNIITISSFIVFAAALLFSALSFQGGQGKWFGAIGGVLSLIGLGVYLLHLTIGIIGLVIIACLVVGIVTFELF
jgi:hypothetical protein